MNFKAKTQLLLPLGLICAHTMIGVTFNDFLKDVMKPSTPDRSTPTSEAIEGPLLPPNFDKLPEKAQKTQYTIKQRTIDTLFSKLENDHANRTKLVTFLAKERDRIGKDNDDFWNFIDTKIVENKRPEELANLKTEELQKKFQNVQSQAAKAHAVQALSHENHALKEIDFGFESFYKEGNFDAACNAFFALAEIERNLEKIKNSEPQEQYRKLNVFAECLANNSQRLGRVVADAYEGRPDMFCDHSSMPFKQHDRRYAIEVYRRYHGKVSPKEATYLTWLKKALERSTTEKRLQYPLGALSGGGQNVAAAAAQSNIPQQHTTSGSISASRQEKATTTAPVEDTTQKELSSAAPYQKAKTPAIQQQQASPHQKSQTQQDKTFDINTLEKACKNSAATQEENCKNQPVVPHQQSSTRNKPSCTTIKLKLEDLDSSGGEVGLPPSLQAEEIKELEGTPQPNQVFVDMVGGTNDGPKTHNYSIVEDGAKATTFLLLAQKSLKQRSPNLRTALLDYIRNTDNQHKVFGGLIQNKEHNVNRELTKFIEELGKENGQHNSVTENLISKVISTTSQRLSKSLQ